MTVVTGCAAMNGNSAHAVAKVHASTDPGRLASQESDAVACLEKANAELQVYRDVFEWLEKQAKASQTGISFDWVPSLAGDPSGWRFMRRHFIGDAGKSLLSAIDKARLAIDGIDRAR
jgi:hypothetical protein